MGTEGKTHAQIFSLEWEMTNSHHGNYKFHTWIFGKFSDYFLLFVLFKRRACQKLKHRGKDRKIDNSKLLQIFTVTFAAFIRRISGLCFWFTYWSWQGLEISDFTVLATCFSSSLGLPLFLIDSFEIGLAAVE